MAYPAKKKKGSPKREAREDVEAAKGLAFRFLSYRARSTDEVRKKLAGAGFSPSAIAAAIARISELGYLNDYDFSLTFGRSCLEHKLWGPARIRDELAHKGVDSEVISSVLRELEGEHDLSRVAKRALQARFSRTELQKPTGRNTQRRAVDYLIRKGFSWSTITAVIASDDNGTG